MFIGSPPLRLSAYTNQDSDGNAMLPAHAYKARSDGEISAIHDVDFGSGRSIKLFVGSTSNPAGAGDKVQESENDGNSYKNQRSVVFSIAKNEYFEVTVFSGTPQIRWRSIGRLQKPVDFN